MRLHRVQIAALVHTEISGEEPSPLHYWSPLVGTKTSFLSHPEVKCEGQFDGVLTVKGSVHPNHTKLTPIVGSSHAGWVYLSRFEISVTCFISDIDLTYILSFIRCQEEEVHSFLTLYGMNYYLNLISPNAQVWKVP